LAALVGALALVVSACGGGQSAPSAQPATSSAISSSPTPSGSASSSAPADPSHAVAPPGPRTAGLASADLLVFSQQSLPASVVAAVRHLHGVTDVVPISLAQVSIQDQLVPLVAADPATYRLFEPSPYADHQAFWERVAGGELAVPTTLRKLAPTDAGGYVKLGSSATAPEIHVGAYIAPVPGVPAVVANQAWGQALGMPAGNALLVSTGGTSPDRVVKPVRGVVGKSVSVQRLDVVAREGLDPGSVQTAYVVGSVADAVGHYTYRVLGGGRVAPDPAWVAAHITTETVPILGAVTCNRMLFPQLKAALAEVVQRGLAQDIHTYNGCYNPRFIAGTTSLSNHAFGLAIDIDAATNGRGTSGTMNPAVVQIFEKWGFTWGGTWHYTDPMHFEMNRVVSPG
jgi:hypothetical protein